MLLLSLFTLSPSTLCGLFNSVCWLYLDFLSMEKFAQETTKNINKALHLILTTQQAINLNMFSNTIGNMMNII